MQSERHLLFKVRKRVGIGREWIQIPLRSLNLFRRKLMPPAKRRSHSAAPRFGKREKCSSAVPAVKQISHGYLFTAGTAELRKNVTSESVRTP
jgi:hypothetical protein